MKRIFYITTSDITVFHWERHQILDAIRFHADEAGQIKFLHYIEREPKTPSYALVDLIEEEFQQISVPRLSSANRKQLFERKLNSHFRHAPHRLAIHQGRHRSEPKQDEALLTALTNPDTLSVFLSWVQLCHVPLRGIYSVPLISHKIMRALKVNDPYAMLVTEQGKGQFRQSFFQKLLLKTSRLSKPREFDRTQLETTILKELQNSQRYLNRFNLLPHNKKLSAYIICNDEDYDRLMANLETNSQWNYKLIHAQRLEHDFKFKSKLDARYMEMLYAHLLCTHRFAENYAKSHDKRYFYFERLKSALIGASFALSGASIAYASQVFVNTEGTKATIELSKQKATFLNQTLANAISKKPAIPYRPQAVWQSVLQAKRLQTSRFDTEKLLVAIATQLQNQPAIVLDQLSWKSSYQAPANKIQNTRFAPQHAAMDANYIYRTVRLTAHFENYQGDTVETFKAIKRFRDQLAKVSQFKQIKLINLPVNIKSTQLSQGNTGTLTSHKPIRFTVEFLIRSRFNED